MKVEEILQSFYFHLSICYMKIVVIGVPIAKKL